MDLSIKYLGFTLQNPIIVASSGLTQNVDKIKACEDAGAGAVVMKSLFEEQIRQQNLGLQESAMMHTEAMEYLQADLEMLYGPREYLQTIEKVKKSVKIPVIASINCYTSKWWLDYAEQIEAAGADALELNVYIFPFAIEKSSAELEDNYIEILKLVKEKVKLPVAFKISPYFTSFGHFAMRLAATGANGLVLFNRFVQPEIDTKKMKSQVKGMFNDPVGFYNTLRWIGLLSGKLNLDLAASGNIKEANDVVKQLLAGAAVVQLASVLYTEGLEKIRKILTGLETWMKEKNYQSIQEFKGKLNQINDAQSMTFIRSQYIKTVSGLE
ncbi:dihydroorotate dehydrogenase-like protein [candidate division KSB1 bacterium]|nr:dihydroorotate dehydrogenase-like protein [candidate division KSB1 bacterium]